MYRKNRSNICYISFVHKLFYQEWDREIFTIFYNPQICIIYQFNKSLVIGLKIHLVINLGDPRNYKKQTYQCNRGVHFTQGPRYKNLINQSFYTNVIILCTHNYVCGNLQLLIKRVNFIIKFFCSHDVSSNDDICKADMN